MLGAAAGVAHAAGALLAGDRGLLAGLGVRPRASRTGSRSSSRATPSRVGAAVGNGRERPTGRVKVGPVGLCPGAPRAERATVSGQTAGTERESRRMHPVEGSGTLDQKSGRQRLTGGVLGCIPIMTRYLSTAPPWRVRHCRTRRTSRGKPRRWLRSRPGLWKPKCPARCAAR